MEIYIEIFIIQNILINFCLLKLVQLTTKTKSSFFRLLFASTIGTIPSVFITIFISNTFIYNLSKLITAGIMIFSSFKQSKKQFTFNLILLFLYTYAFGGIVTGLSSATYFTSFGAVITSKFNLELICLIFIIFTYIFELVAKHFKLKINTNSLIFNCTLTQSNKSIKINAYLDTGNFLNLNGQPVLILDINSYLKLTQTNLIDFLTKESKKISTSTVNGNNNLKVFNIDQVELKNGKKKIQLKNQPVAINTTNCFKNANYQALISPLFL